MIETHLFSLYVNMDFFSIIYKITYNKSMTFFLYFCDVEKNVLPRQPRKSENVSLFFFLLKTGPLSNLYQIIHYIKFSLSKKHLVMTDHGEERCRKLNVSIILRSSVQITPKFSEAVYILF